MYGRRGRIGLITLASDTSVLPEYARVMPDDVAVYAAPIVLPRGEVTAAALAEMLASDQLEHAAALLVWADVDVIVFACTTGSLVHGVGWDREVAGRIERASGRPATTTTTAVLGALRAVGATSLAVNTPYVEELNAIERRFLEASGFAVASIGGLGCVTDAEIGRLEPANAVSLVERIDTPEADAVFISCTNFHCLPAIASLERQAGKPVVTSNLAGAWAALRQLGIADTIPGYGQLLHLPAATEAIGP
jgi:maleate isomerase